MRDEIFPMLVVDAGNTSVKVAVVERPGGKPRLLGTLDHRHASRARFLRRSVQARAAFAASVVPATNDVLCRAWPSMSLVGPDTVLNFRCAVDRSTVGADRLANMAEAARRFGSNVLVADFGTAATFDLLDARGCFAGGAITPGLRMMAGALHQGTAQLPFAALRAPRRYAGRNTAEALQAGVAGGWAGLVRHLVAQLAPRGTRLVFTGGDARLAARLTGFKPVIDPLWTLRGVAVLGELSACDPISRQARKGRQQ
jgi:type III pantothenate kinase